MGEQNHKESDGVNGSGPGHSSEMSSARRKQQQQENEQREKVAHAAGAAALVVVGVKLVAIPLLKGIGEW